MDDVFGEVVLAGRDEDLGAGDGMAAVGLRLGAGADQAEVGAALGLGQAHGARPGAVGELGQVLLLELVGAVPRQRLVGAMAEARIHGEGLVRGGEHLLQREAHGGRQALAAELGIAGDGGPAAFAEHVVGVLEALGRAHDAVLEAATFLVAAAVEREQHVLAELGRLLHDGVDGVGRGVLVARQLRELRDVEHLVQHELDILQRRLVDGHRVLRRFLVSRVPASRFRDPRRAAAVRRRRSSRHP